MNAGGRATQEQLPRTRMPKVGAFRRHGLNGFTLILKRQGFFSFIDLSVFIRLSVSSVIHYKISILNRVKK